MLKQIESSPELLYNLKKSVELWFHGNNLSHSTSTTQIVEAVLCILINGLKNMEYCISYKNYQEFANNWLNYSINYLDDIFCKKITDHKTFRQILSSWILKELENSTLYLSLETMLVDTELLNRYYNENAFLRDETYANSFITCLKAVEFRDPSFLSLISQSLYIPINESSSFRFLHRRSSSHPHFSVSTSLFAKKEKEFVENTNYETMFEKKLVHPNRAIQVVKINVDQPLLIIRKCKSLPNIIHSFEQRPRSQTVSQPMSIPKADVHVLRMEGSNYSKCKTSFSLESQYSIPDFKYQDTSAGCSSFDGKNFKESQNSYEKGAIKKVLTPENNQHSKRSCQEKAKINKSLKLSKASVNSENIKIHFDRNSPNSKLMDSNENETVKYDSSLLLISSKSMSPRNFLSCISKNIFSPKSDPVLIQPVNRFITKSNSSSIGDLFSKSLTTSDVLGSFVGSRDGEKLVKAQTNMFDDFVLENNFQNNIENETNMSNTIGDNQNLASLLKTNLFSSNHTDLERENAHFKVSEAVISVIENIKWRKAEVAMNNKDAKKGNIVDKDENKISTINLNKIGEKKIEKSNKKIEIIEVVETATSYLYNKEDSSAPSTAESANEDKDYDELLESYDNILPEHVAYAEWGCGFDALSAENVGLSLISKFNDTDLPRVSELKWLVSDEICTRYNVPQDLLPIPDVNMSENPDDHIVHQIQRGTKYWAPPRKQIIFTDHVSTTRKEQMQKQNYRCTGCGMRVAPIYSSRFRFCYYLGKYHCTGCHRNHKSIIPAKVLKKWDFELYPVSVFSYRLLEEIWQYPLFELSELSPFLYKSVRSLGVAKSYRTQLKYLKDFITTCRFSQSEEKLFYEIQTYVTSDPDKWSMSDFVDTKGGILQKNLKAIIDKCEKHIYSCVLCSARGFICELCLEAEPIYPWQLKVKRCDKCGICYHTKCFKKLNHEECCKCYRLAKKSFNEKL